MPPRHPVRRPYKPDPQECAILLTLLVKSKATDSGKETTRLRVAEITLKRLWGRHRLSEDFLLEVEEWLFRAGWTLFYAGTTFALVTTKSVQGWPRVSSKRLAAELEQVADGEFDFDEHLDVLLEEEGSEDED
jgi:hypothetical protein